MAAHSRALMSSAHTFFEDEPQKRVTWQAKKSRRRRQGSDSWVWSYKPVEFITRWGGGICSPVWLGGWTITTDGTDDGCDGPRTFHLHKICKNAKTHKINSKHRNQQVQYHNCAHFPNFTPLMGDAIAYLSLNWVQLSPPSLQKSSYFQYSPYRNFLVFFLKNFRSQCFRPH